MNFEIGGIIKVKENNSINQKLELFLNRNRIEIIPDSNDPNKIIINISTQAESKEKVEIIGKEILNEICDKLSFFTDMKIASFEITGFSYESISEDGRFKKNCISLMTSISFRSNVEINITTNFYSELVENLSKCYPREIKEIMKMWREAISADAEFEQYLLLYRILEKMIGSREKIDKWIKAKIGSEELFNNDQDKDNGKITIFTWIRDNIHPKQVDLPREKIKKYLPKLQAITKIAIKEKF